MNKQVLALHGGERAITRSFEPYSTMGPEEAEAAKRVVESGVLSQFLGEWHEDFFGGPNVRAFENAWAEKFHVKHAVTFNSWTSGLSAAVGAVGVEPGDEVIVTPWTMTASAAAILHWSAIPVFVDIDVNTYCLDPESVERAISPFTTAIMSVDIFGQSADMTILRNIANNYGLKLISDTAQAPLAEHNGKFAGTIADIGGYSLNYHKHIHTGEGGVAVTDDDEFAKKLRLIRNHAEAVVGDMNMTSLPNMVGHNLRLGEIEAAIGLEQLKKLDSFVKSRQGAAERLRNGLEGLHGLSLPYIAPGNTHVFYAFPMQLNHRLTRVSRQNIVAALQAEGVTVGAGYQNLHLQPLYQHKVAYGSRGFPWSSEICRRDIDYSLGLCPTAEGLHAESYMGLGMCAYAYADEEIDLVIDAFRKVWGQLDTLQ